MVFVALSPLAPTVSVTFVSAVTGAAAVARTVTDDCATFSATLTLAGTVVSAIVGRSSSASVTRVPVTVVCGLVPATPMVSSPSRAVSSVGVRVNVPVPLVAFAAIVMSKFDTAL